MSMRRDYLVVVLLCGLVFSYDISRRILISNDASATTDQIQPLAESTELKTLSNAELDSIINLYQRFHQDSDESASDQPATISQELIDNQQGELNEFLTEKHRYRLRATFSQPDETFALLESHSVENNKKELVKVNINDNLHGYQLKSILESSVILIKQDKEIQLRLFQP